MKMQKLLNWKSAKVIEIGQGVFKAAKVTQKLYKMEEINMAKVTKYGGGVTFAFLLWYPHFYQN